MDGPYSVPWLVYHVDHLLCPRRDSVAFYEPDLFNNVAVTQACRLGDNMPVTSIRADSTKMKVDRFAVFSAVWASYPKGFSCGGSAGGRSSVQSIWQGTKTLY